jgi:G:T-mismatch repair DNA endonuclease (very short patch repair protein)
LERTYPEHGTSKFISRYPVFGRQQIVGIANRHALHRLNYHWSAAELKILKKFYPLNGVAGVSRELPSRTRNQITHMAVLSGLQCVLRPKPYPELELKFLRRTYTRFGTGLFLARYPGRSPQTVYSKARSMGLTCPYKLQLAHRRPNMFECAVKRLLDKNFHGLWRYTGNGQKYINGRFPDFIHRKRRIVLLANGIYWHTKRIGVPNVPVAEEIECKDYENAGYKVIFIWDYEMKNPKDVVEKIQSCI